MPIVYSAILSATPVPLYAMLWGHQPTTCCKILGTAVKLIHCIVRTPCFMMQHSQGLSLVHVAQDTGPKQHFRLSNRSDIRPQPAHCGLSYVVSKKMSIKQNGGFQFDPTLITEYCDRAMPGSFAMHFPHLLLPRRGNSHKQVE